MADDPKVSFRGGDGARSRALFSIRVSTAQQSELDSALEGIRNGVNRAISAAINAATRKGRDFARKTVRRALALLDPTALDARFRNKRATPSRLAGDIWISGRSVALTQFEVRDTRNPKGWGTAASGQGVFLKTFETQGEQQFPHAFVATGKQFGTAVFQRQRRGAGTWRDRRKLTRMPAVPTSEIFEKTGLVSALQGMLEEELPRQLDAQVNRLLAARR